MKILILKDKEAHDLVSHKKLTEAFFSGYWDDAVFVIVKDRLNGRFNTRLSSTQLVAYINELELYLK